MYFRSKLAGIALASAFARLRRRCPSLLRDGHSGVPLQRLSPSGLPAEESDPIAVSGGAQ
jgi:hypothetical protein